MIFYLASKQKKQAVFKSFLIIENVSCYLGNGSKQRIGKEKEQEKQKENGEHEKMKRVKLIVSYDGTNYCGWQIQPNGVTI